VEGIREASLEDLEAIPKMNGRAAQQVFSFFHRNS